VGLYYLPAAYDLHWHMGYLLEKIERRKQTLMAQVQAAGQTDLTGSENEESQKRT
jgi:hypothetical protein